MLLAAAVAMGSAGAVQVAMQPTIRATRFAAPRCVGAPPRTVPAAARARAANLVLTGFPS